MKNRKYHLTRRATLISLAAALLLWTGCDRRPSATTQPAATEAVTTLRVAYRRGTISDPLPILLFESGVVGKHVKVELVAASAPADALNKLDAGEADAAAGIPVEALLGQLAAGAPKFTAYGYSVEEPGSGWLGIAVGPNVQAKTIADLAGQPIGVLPVRQAQYLVDKIIRDSGVPADQVKIEKFNPLTPMAGLRGGQFVGVYGPEPLMAQTLNEGGRILAAGPTPKVLGEGEPLPVIASVLSKAFAERHPEAAAEYKQLIRQAAVKLAEHPDTARPVFAKPAYGGLPEGVWSRLSFPAYREPSADTQRVGRRMVDVFLKDGVLQKDVDLAPLFPAQ